MALFPCDYCGQRYRGPQQTAYPALLHDSASMREKRRACPPCFRAVLEWAQLGLDLVQDGYVVPEPTCCIDREPIDTHLTVFLTLYPRGEDRSDFWGKVCQVHLDTAAEALFGPQRPASWLPAL